MSAIGPADGRQARRQPFRERAHRLHFEDRRAGARCLRDRAGRRRLRRCRAEPRRPSTVSRRRSAHRMAILAMHQTGMMLCAMHARLQPAETLAAIRRAIAESRIPVWLPLKLADGDTAITRDWKTTSDGLGGAARRAAGRRAGGAGQIVSRAALGVRRAPRQGRDCRSDVRGHRRARAAILAGARLRR